MPASNSWREEVAKDIIWDFERLLCINNTKINNKNIDDNVFERDDSFINKKDYEELKENIKKQLKDYEDYIKYKLQDAA